MFKTLGIRTLMVCGVVTLTTLMAQQLLGNEVEVVDGLQITSPSSFSTPEGNNNLAPLKFALLNTSKEKTINLTSFTAFQSKSLGDDPDNGDFLTVVDSSFPNKRILEPGDEATITVTVNPAGGNVGSEDNDSGTSNVSSVLSFTGISGKLDMQTLFVDGKVNDSNLTPVPESSTLLLVGVCALIVCGVGWLRRSRILSKV